MMRRIAPLLLIVAVFAAILSGCGKTNNDKTSGNIIDTATSYEDFIGADVKFGVQIGDVFDTVAKETFKANDKNLVQFQTMTDLFAALDSGKVDAALISDVYGKQLQFNGLYPDFNYFQVPLELYSLEAGAIFHSDELRDKWNAWFAGIKADGTWERLCAFWIDNPLPDAKDILAYEFTGENGTLVMADTGNYPPLAYIAEDGQLSGLDVEMASLFAQHMGMNLEIKTMSYDGIIPYVQSGKAQMSSCSLVLTEERQEGISMGDAFVISGVHLVTRGGNATVTAKMPTTEDFIGEKFAVTVGTVYDQLANGYFQSNNIVYVESNVEALESVRTGKANVMLLNGVMTADVLSKGAYPELTSITMSDTVPFPEGITNDIAALFNSQDMINEYNKFLAEIKADGTLKEMKNRWLMGGTLPSSIPDIPITGENGVLNIAITGEKVPFDYVGDGGVYIGFEVEHMTRFAAYLGKKPVFHAMSFGAIIPYVQSGKADVGASDFNITEERKQSVLFGDPYMKMDYELVFRKADFGITDSAPAQREVTLDTFKGKKFAIEIGTGFEDYAYDIFEASKDDVLIYDGIGAMESVLMGLNDCTIVDLTAVIPFLNQEHFKPLTYYTIPEDICFDRYAAISDTPEYIEQFNEFLKTITADGTLEEMTRRWVDNFDSNNPPDMPDIPQTSENGVLKVATSSICMPFVFLSGDNEIIGFEAELMTRFAASLGKTVQFADMSYDALLLYVKSGKCDISAAMYYYKDERAENIYFSDSYYDALTAVVYRKADFESGTSSISWQDYKGKKFGVMVGSVYDKIADDVFNASEKLYFESVPDEIEAVRNGKADAVLFDEIVWMVTSSTEEYNDLQAVSVPLDGLVFEYGAFSINQEWIDKYNAWLAEAKADGTYDEMVNRWLTDFSYDTVVPEIHTTGANGTLKVAIYPYAPFTFIGKESKWHGFDIEQFTRFAASLGMNVEFTDMTFAALLPYVASGKSDFGASAYITPERAEQVIFTEPNAKSGTAIVIKKALSTANEPASFDFIKWVKEGVQKNLLTENRWKMMVSGLGVTLQISFLSQIFGTMLGAFCAYLLTRKARLPRYIAGFYSGLIHGTPMVVLLMISYYIVFGKSEINSIVIAVAAFTLVEGAVIGGKLNTAISTVDPVEIEAARSMGYSAIRAFFRVTLPQAIKVALPGYLNGFVELVKATAIVGYIAIQDLSRAGDIIRSRTYDAYFPLLFVALVYLIITTLCVQLFKLIIRRLSK